MQGRMARKGRFYDTFVTEGIRAASLCLRLIAGLHGAQGPVL